MDLKNAANIVGSASGVALIFGPTSSLSTKDGANVSLVGLQTGALAGCVLATTRDRTAEFRMNSDPVSKITGAIYIPNALFTVEGSKNAAASSDWTVIAAKSLQLGTGTAPNPNLVINANYSGSLVPVPSGVGPNAGSRLSR